jgi:Domain of unknown function (DUF4360)
LDAPTSNLGPRTESFHNQLLSTNRLRGINLGSPTTRTRSSTASTSLKSFYRIKRTSYPTLKMRFSITTLTALLGALVAASPLQLHERAEQNPPNSTVWIESLTWSGSGCTPTDQVATSLSDDRSTVTIIYPNFVAYWDGDPKDIAQSRKNCQVNFKLHYPQGFSYTIVSAQYRGQITEDNTCSASMLTTYYFSGQTQEVSYQSPASL